MIGTKDENDQIIRLNLFGYVSTTKNRNRAENFAFEDAASGKKRVLYHIDWDYQYNHYFMDMGAFAHEEEVLLMDGMRLKV